MSAVWLPLLVVALLFGLRFVLVLGMFAVEWIEWRREQRTGELMEHLTMKGQHILERERR